MHWVRCSKSFGQGQRFVVPGCGLRQFSESSTIESELFCPGVQPGPSFPCSKRQRTPPALGIPPMYRICQPAKLLGVATKHFKSGGAHRTTVLARPTHPYLCHSLSRNVLFHVLILVSKLTSDSLTDLIAGKTITQLLVKLPVGAESIVGQNR
jgi:hypothetical protein